MSTVSESGARASSGKRIGALVLAIVGVLLLIVAVVYFTTNAGSLPSFLPGHTAGSSHTHHLRAGVAAVVGIVALASAWWVGFGGKKAAAGK